MPRLTSIASWRTIASRLALIVLLVIGAVSASAQRSMSVQQLRLLDSALALIGQQRSDCAMPPDLFPADRHRLPFHDRLFTDPFSSFDVADDIRQQTMFASENDMASLADTLMHTLGLGKYRRRIYDIRIPGEEIVRKLGSDPYPKAGYIGATLLLRYASAVIQARDGMTVAHDRIINQPMLVAMCDSLWRLSRENETSSIWDLYDDEVAGRKKAASFFLVANPGSYTDLYVNGLSLYEQLLDFVRLSADSRQLMNDSVKTTIIDTPYGRIAVGGAGDDIYEGTFFLIVDVGGNDVYRCSDSGKTAALKTYVRCIVDLGGNDTYIGGDFTLGSGVAGVGIIIDNDGNDLYRAGDFSVACGLFGVGIVHDLLGDDTYTSGSNGQGAGIFGIGLLIDDAGHDTYRAHAQAQGFGATRGVGILSDKSGNDQYLAASPYVDVLRYESHQTTFTQGAALGYRPLASGGMGLLIDHGGNDQYVCDIYGQGTGYWFGLGAVIDVAGDDRYQAYQYAQGAGVHFASGIMRDMRGDDVYVSHGVSQGCGHDIAFGMLLDDAGNDNYVVESLSLGGGNANAVSIALDEKGNDSYSATNTSNTLGFSDFRRSYGMIGLFIDGDGTDTYGSTSRNESRSIKSTYGVFYDTKRVVREDTVVESPLATATTSVDPTPLADTPEMLFIQASAAPLRFQNNVQPARDKLAAMGTGAMPEIEEHLTTQMPRERLTLEDIIPRIHKTSPEVVELLIRESLLSNDNAEVALAATLAGKIKARSAVPSLVYLATDTLWRLRRLAAFTLGEIGDSSNVPLLQTLIRDPHPYVRARAAYALGLVGGNDGFRLVREALVDDEAIVRNSAVEGLVRGPKRPMTELTRWISSVTDPLVLATGVRVLAASDTTTRDAQAFVSFVRTSPESVRRTVDMILPVLPAFWQKSLTPELPIKKKRKKRP
ncbi:MAG: HEAT repeat domain-containing protein [bacterium]|nr:HEAT repeat domain-containing protein [bacterium]